MKFLKHLFLLFMCLISSIFLCMKIFDDILVRITVSEYSYLIVRVFLTLLLYYLILSIKNKQVRKYKIHIVFLIYLICILTLTFFKGAYGDGVAGINLNPLEIINDFNLSSNTLLLLLGNLFLYIPIGIYIRYILNISSVKLFLGIIIYCIIIESIQYITKLGIFDINDIILNSCGFIIGVLIYEKIRRICANSTKGINKNNTFNMKRYTETKKG
ncbi:VanZ family protein [Clostridium baratii]|uniref:VanZ family protein n=1 Tax=Clostridium baratii TaxID=1561 RepID=A0A174PPP3_9CLOT|nr:VanZ family protein [Clostridium baratii]CUP61586.1 VanZ family protein [Clostridium baratii]